MRTVIPLGARHAGTPAGITWCHRMGLDPSWVVVPNTITLDDEARTVTVERYSRLDANGRTIVDGDRNCLVTDPVVVQLEAPALPLGLD